MISYPFPPQTSAGGVRSERFARHLRTFGWEAHVITAKHEAGGVEKEEKSVELVDTMQISIVAAPDPYLWLRRKNPTNILGKRFRGLGMELFSFPDHMHLWAHAAVREGRRIMKRRQIDAIYTTSPPHSSHLAGLQLARDTGLPWVADFRDPWTLNTYALGLRKSKVLRFIERRLELKVLRHARLILANTRANRENLLKEFPWLGEEKVVHLPNGLDGIETDHGERQATEGLTIVHSGTFYPSFKPYALLHAIAAWRRGEIPDTPFPGGIRVLLLGAEDPETRGVVRTLGLEDIVEIRCWVPLVEARMIMRRADLLWTSLGTGSQSSTYVPSKLFEYLAVQRPIIGFFAEGEAAEIIRGSRAGVVFTGDDPVPVIDFLSRSMDQKRKLSRLLYEPNDKFIEKYRFENIARRFASLLDQL